MLRENDQSRTKGERLVTEGIRGKKASFKPLGKLRWRAQSANVELGITGLLPKLDDGVWVC